jgi:adenylate kinase
MEPRTIFFIGKPGCGKGDQARMLSEKTGWPTFSSGNLFREIAQEDTPVGHKVKEENYAGILQPYWFAMFLFMKTLFSLSENEGAIFDGFARKIPEAETIAESLAWLGRSFSVLHLKVSDEEIKRRLELRKGIEGRADDNVVDKRLEEYCANTEPVIEMFRAKGMLIEINGERTREEIAADIRKTLSIE